MTEYEVHIDKDVTLEFRLSDRSIKYFLCSAIYLNCCFDFIIYLNVTKYQVVTDVKRLYLKFIFD